MKNHIKNLFMLPALIAGLCLMLADSVTAQTFTTLHSFADSDGANPICTLILSGNTLYGTTVNSETGGTNGNGRIFAINTDGTGFTNLYYFTAMNTNSFGVWTNSDGAQPEAGLILSGNTLYGTVRNGGSAGEGTVFAVNTNGTGFSNLYSFTVQTYVAYYGSETNSDGAHPNASLVLSGSTLYGTAQYDGTAGEGTVFSVSTNGTGFTNMHNFGAFPPDPTAGSSNGVFPEGLVLSGDTLYGTAALGGSSGNGMVFAINTNGMDYTNLYSFTATSNYTNSDGALPENLILSGNILYGIAREGGSAGDGTVFAVNTNGTDFTNLYSFTVRTFGPSDFLPESKLILSGNILYGTTEGGFNSGSGTMFAINTDGSGFTNLYSFSTWSSKTIPPWANSDGAQPHAGLILSGNALYGTAVYGGSSDDGTVFRLSLPLPQLTINPSGTNVILTWPTNGIGINYSGFTLQYINNLSSGSWSNITSGITTIGTNYLFTNSVNSNASFFRLMQ